ILDDIDGDGIDEIVTISLESNNGYDDGIITVYDAATKNMEWQSQEDLFGSRAWTGLRDLAAGQLDDDPQKEIVVGASDLYDGALYIIDGITHELEHSFIYPDMTTFQAVEVVDIDGDGDQEIVAAESDNVHFIDPRTGSVERSFFDTVDTYIVNMDLADVDGDGGVDILLSAWISTIYTPVKEYFKVINPRTGGAIGYQTNELYSMATIPAEGDGMDLVFGTLNGELVLRYGQSFVEKKRWKVIDQNITSLRTYDVDADGVPEVIFTAEDKWGIFDIEKEKLLYVDSRSGFYGSGSDIIPGDTDNDGRFDVIIGSSFSVSSFELAEAEIRRIKAWTVDPATGWRKTVFRKGDIIRFVVNVETESDTSVPIYAEGTAAALKFGNWAFDIPSTIVMSQPGNTVLNWDIPYPDNDSRFLSLGAATISVQTVSSEPLLTSVKFWLAP
ncbi:MAG: VCBS repeat-containing protein, partial [Candidatus Omnitrophica bacterium]|nr:VCBS repeat-containing protein [Candidatus Omnitrophota bacterium]